MLPVNESEWHLALKANKQQKKGVIKSLHLKWLEKDKNETTLGILTTSHGIAMH